MKVLIISASPRKGANSDTLCNQFIKGAEEAGHTTEKIRLAEKNLHPCTACYACGKNHVCAQKDDMAEIQQKLVDADVIVLATPVYFYCMDAQMKMMIDRCLPRFEEMKHKQFYFIVTAADPEHSAVEATLAGLRGFLECLPDAEEKGVIYGTGAWERGDILGHRAMQETYEAGKNL